MAGAVIVEVMLLEAQAKAALADRWASHRAERFVPILQCAFAFVPEAEPVR